MTASRRAWTRRLVVRLGVALTTVACGVVLVGGVAFRFTENGRRGGSVASWGDGAWLALTTMTTLGYGDHVPVTTLGRLVAAAVLVIGVALIGGVAAMVALVVAERVAQEEEHELEQEAGTLERRLEARLAEITARLDTLVVHQEQSLAALAALAGDRADLPGGAPRPDAPTRTP